MNVSQPSPTANRIEFDDSGRTAIGEFDERHICVSRKKWDIELGRSTRLLHQSSKAISPARTNEPAAASEVRGSWLWLLGASVVYFSSYKTSIPLLAPALGLVWLVKFSLNIRAAVPKDWLVVNDDWGMLVVQIRAPGADSGGPSGHKLFVHALSKAIESAKQ